MSGAGGQACVTVEKEGLMDAGFGSEHGWHSGSDLPPHPPPHQKVTGGGGATPLVVGRQTPPPPLGGLQPTVSCQSWRP